VRHGEGVDVVQTPGALVGLQEPAGDVVLAGGAGARPGL